MVELSTSLSRYLVARDGIVDVHAKSMCFLPTVSRWVIKVDKVRDANSKDWLLQDQRLEAEKIAGAEKN